MQKLCAVPEQQLFNFFVGSDIGATEPVNSLFRIAHDEQLPRIWLNRSPVRRFGSICRQQHENLCLQRVGILELIDEQVSEAFLEVFPHAPRLYEEVPSTYEEVEEIESSRALLEPLVFSHGFT